VQLFEFCSHWLFLVPSGLALYSPVFTALFAHLRVALAAEAGCAVFGPVRTGPRRLIAARADDLQLRELDGRLALDDTALLILLRIRAGVLLREVHPLDDRLSLRGIDAQDFALLAAVFPREDDHAVVLADVRLDAARLFVLLFRFSVHGCFL